MLFSAPFRNLQDKTQVFPLPENAFVHTRLTHSLEVASVGRSLGKQVGDFLLQRYTSLQENYTTADIAAIVSAAALCHDIGNPPFGHAGETALSDYFRFGEYGMVWQRYVQPEEWEDLIAFEGNAQGLRMLSAPQSGLNLSAATVAAFMKYPRPAQLFQPDPHRKSQKKYGFFADQAKDVEALYSYLGIPEIGSGAFYRHPLSFLVEAADDICYSMIDLEDACTLGLISENTYVELLASLLGHRFQPEKLRAYPEKTQRLAVLRSLAIGTLIDSCAAVFREEESAMRKGTFDQALTSCIPEKEPLNAIAHFSVQHIYRSAPVLEKEAAGFQVLEGLLEAFLRAFHHARYQTERYGGKDKSMLRLLPESLQLKIKQEEFSTYTLLRLLLDHISGMTDKQSLTLYRKVRGISLPGH
ncbi:dGTP triphosphohydrolase [Nitritalea halalkaliphila]|uniref:dGTP triphosphohydrolase n=1 Tax=Nitritalea halalkaliphila TaxID=590849 RepID=UPI0009FCD041|nr:dNTP triphosphohydrolase [Nitritalea halalkaliphila]